MKWYKLVNEANKTPSDMDIVEKSFNSDVSDEKYVPTLEFVKNAYDKMNKDLFINYLPSTNEMKIEFFNDVKSEELAVAECSFIGIDKVHMPTDFKLSVNTSRVFTVHTWMEIILHEMIHILDYVDHPEHFTDDTDYDSHGEWFHKTAMKFKKYGFDVGRNFTGRAEMNDELDVTEILNNEIFIQVGTAKDGTPKVSKIVNDDKQKFVKVLTRLGLKKTTIYKSRNPLSVEIPLLRSIKDTSRPASYYMDEEFLDEYGPFEEIETIDLGKTIVEDSSEDDVVLRNMKSVKGVVVAKKIGNNKYHIGIA